MFRSLKFKMAVTALLLISSLMFYDTQREMKVHENDLLTKAAKLLDLTRDDLRYRMQKFELL